MKLFKREIFYGVQPWSQILMRHWMHVQEKKDLNRYTTIYMKIGIEPSFSSFLMQQKPLEEKDNYSIIYMAFMTVVYGIPNCW